MLQSASQCNFLAPPHTYLDSVSSSAELPVLPLSLWVNFYKQRGNWVFIIKLESCFFFPCISGDFV